MLPAITTKPIVFDNSREAGAVFPSANATAKEIADALQIKPPKALLLIIGGADSIDEKAGSRLVQLFGRGIARAAADLNAVIIDGGTQSGVMKMMGQGVADRGFKSPLIGVAPLGLVSYPGSQGEGKTPLDPNHSHFVLVEGNEWGSETNVIFKLMSGLASKAHAVVLLAGGGAVSKNESLQAVRQSLPLIVIEGSGDMADEIAAAWRAKPDLPDDPVMAEIIADGRIELLHVSNSVRSAERLLIRELGGDTVLRQAWERFAIYDSNAIDQQKRFDVIQGSILLIGLLATALALYKQVRVPRNPNGTELMVRWSFWWFAKYILIVLPIGLSILITAANRFKQGNKWLLLRAGAESIKREIYRYRARAGAYKETFAPPTPDQVLAERVEDITQRTMRTEVNSSSLILYTKEIPPIKAVAREDDGFSLLTPDRYVLVRLVDQHDYYRRKAVNIERRLRRIQWSIFIIGGLGTLLAAINLQVWIALTTAVAAALTAYLGYKQTENTLTKYNQAATDLESVRSWWTALPPDDQAKQENLDTLVDHTEMVLQSELDGWVQQMQNALAELRKGQERAPAEGPLTGGGGIGGHTIPAANPAAVKAAAEAAKKLNPAVAELETGGDANQEAAGENGELSTSGANPLESDTTNETGEASTPEPETAENLIDETPAEDKATGQ